MFSKSLSVLKLTFNNQKFTLKQFQDSWKVFIRLESVDAWSSYISEENQNKADEYLPVITYVAGYCAYSVWKKLQCNMCRLVLILIDKNTDYFNHSLITGLNRGSSLYPSDDEISIVYLT